MTMRIFMRKEAASTKGTWIEEIRIGTVEPRDNEGLRDWHNLFAIPRFRYIEVLLQIYYTITGVQKIVRSYRGLRSIEIRYIEVPL